MKFKIIAGVIVVVFLLMLTIIFWPAPVNEDGTPTNTQTEEVQ